MTRTLLRPWLMMMVGLMGPIACVQAETGGAIPVQVNIPDMAQKGWAYRVALPQVDSAPAKSQLTELAWRYEPGPGGAPFKAWLCTPSACVALEMAQGSTDAFAGLPASTPLLLRFVMPGKGMLKRPVQGGTAQIFINYRLQDQ